MIQNNKSTKSKVKQNNKMYYVSLRSVMYVTISASNDVPFVFTSRCLQAGSCLIYVICVCVRIVVSKNILWCCFVFHPLVYLMLPVSLNYPFLNAPSVFFTVYINSRTIWTQINTWSQPMCSRIQAFIFFIINGHDTETEST